MEGVLASVSRLHGGIKNLKSAELERSSANDDGFDVEARTDRRAVTLAEEFPHMINSVAHRSRYKGWCLVRPDGVTDNVTVARINDENNRQAVMICGRQASLAVFRI
jgi:hypothetical protein